MPQLTTTTCDYCGAHLAPQSRPSYRLVLIYESNGAPPNGYSDLVLVYPPLSRPAYFCTKTCLVRWLANDNRQRGTI